MVTVADLELLFPGRGALAAGVLRNSGILTDEPALEPVLEVEIVVVAPEPEPEVTP
jgi:hypothetical protein